MLVLHLLGHLTIEINGQLLSSLPSRTAEALLIYVACQNRPVARETLAELFWDERHPDQALANLRSLLSALRKELGEYLVISRAAIGFQAKSEHRVDVRLFEQQMAGLSGWVQPTLLPPQLEALQTALSLYQGDFLAHFSLRDGRGFEAWVLGQRERLRRLAAQGYQKIVRHCLATGEYGLGMGYAGSWLEIDPWREEAHRQMMMLLMRNGQRNGALWQYEKCRQILADELGVSPTDETNRLYEHIRSIQTIGANNLPSYPTPFVGREQDLREIIKQLANPACRMLTLLGSGGMGKTRLALQVAQTILDNKPGMFLHGCWFVSLEALASAQLLAGQIAQAIGFAFRGSAPFVQQLQTHLREKEMLLVLDNFEQLLEEDAGIHLLTQLLQQAPNLKFLITSRQRLNVREEWVYDLAGLTYPPSGEESAAQQWTDFSAIILFVQNAQRVQHNFQPTVEDVPALIQICQLLEGLPLAIEIASAWIRQYNCTQVLQQIHIGLDFLTTPYRNQPARHRSLRAVFEHSWNLLPPPMQVVYQQLSIFPTDFTAEAAQKVAQASLSILQELTDRSLCRHSPDQRYQLHALLRHYAHQKLEAEKQFPHPASQRHAHYYAQLLHQHTPQLNTPEEKTLVALLERDLDNIHAAWQLALAMPNLALLNQMVYGLAYLYECGSMYQTGWETFDLAHQAISQLPPHPDLASLQGSLLGRSGRFAYRLGRPDDARRCLQQAVEILRSTANQSELALILIYLAEVEGQEGNLSAGISLLQQSLTLAQAIPNPQIAVFALLHLGNAHIFNGNYPTAKNYYEQGLQSGAYAGSPRQLATFLDNLGTVARETGDYPTARSYFQKSLDLRHAQNDRWGIAISHNNLAVVTADQGDQPQSIHLFQKAADLFHEIGFRYGQAQALTNIAEEQITLGNPAQAQEIAQTARTIWQELDHKAGLSQIAGILANIATLQKQYPQAIEQYHQAIAFARQAKHQRDLAMMLCQAGVAACQMQDWQTARAHLRESLQIAITIEATPIILMGLIGWAQISYAGGNRSQATQWLQLIIHHPATQVKTKEEAAHLLASLSNHIHPPLLEDPLELVIATILQNTF